MRRPCRNCGRVSATSICQRCKSALDSARPSRQDRGYDALYARNSSFIRARAEAAWTRGESVACVICLQPIGSRDALTIEHITPRRDGGTSDLANLGPAHARCNYGWRRRS